MPNRTLRVRAEGGPVAALHAAWKQARGYVEQNWRLAAALTGSAVALFCLLVVLVRIVPSQGVPEIVLASADTPDPYLHATLFPALAPAEAPTDPAVVRILSVREHVVREGETLSEIAGRYGLRLGTLIDFNAIRDARAIPVGKRLAVPNTDGLRYVVRRGDTLGRIGQRFGVSLNALRDWNDLQTDSIGAGQQLFVPGARLGQDEIDAVLGKLFIYPTRGELTSTFGMRVSPFTKVETLHNGVDLANRTGTPVTASRAGKAYVDYSNPTYGRVVILAHTGGYQTMYAHLDTVLVRSGQTVSQGQEIGTMGSTGQSLGTHLHFTVFRDGVPIDPLTVLR